MGNLLLPPQYQYLNRLPDPPRMITEALNLYGIRETPGPGDNPLILEWGKEVGPEVYAVYQHDATAWCGLFMAVVAKRAGKSLPQNVLWAKDWATFGRALGPLDLPSLGDVLVFARDGGGHVTLYVGEDANYYHCLGGNQSDMVNITRIAKGRLYAVRRPIYKNQPGSVKPFMLDASGPISAGEA